MERASAAAKDLGHGVGIGDVEDLRKPTAHLLERRKDPLPGLVVLVGEGTGRAGVVELAGDCPGEAVFVADAEDKPFLPASSCGQ